MKKRYILEFTLNEKGLLNNISYRKDIVNSLMSVYSYIVKNSKEKSFDISYSELLNRYNRYHSKLTLTTLKNRIAKLVEAGLVVMKKINDRGYIINSYVANRINNDIEKTEENLTEVLTTESTTVWTASESTPDTENTEIEEIKNLPNTKALIPEETKDLDYNTIEYKKNDSVEKAVEVASGLLNKFKVRSKFVKARVLEKVKNYALKMGANTMENYISKIIEESIAKNRTNYTTNKFNTNATKTTKFDNFEARKYQDMDKLERQLLGWEDNDGTALSTKTTNVQQDNSAQNKNECKLKFNNFENRDYDYQSLERKLLGWE